MWWIRGSRSWHRLSPATGEAWSPVSLVHLLPLLPCTLAVDIMKLSTSVVSLWDWGLWVSTSPHLSVGAEGSWQQLSVVTLMYSSCQAKHTFFLVICCSCLFVYVFCIYCMCLECLYCVLECQYVTLRHIQVQSVFIILYVYISMS